MYYRLLLTHVLQAVTIFRLADKRASYPRIAESRKLDKKHRSVVNSHQGAVTHQFCYSLLHVHTQLPSFRSRCCFTVCKDTDNGRMYNNFQDWHTCISTKHVWRIYPPRLPIQVQSTHRHIDMMNVERRHSAIRIILFCGHCTPNSSCFFCEFCNTALNACWYLFFDVPCLSCTCSVSSIN